MYVVDKTHNWDGVLGRWQRSNEYVHAQLEGNRTNKEVYVKIAQEIKFRGYCRSPSVLVALFYIGRLISLDRNFINVCVHGESSGI